MRDYPVIVRRMIILEKRVGGDAGYMVLPDDRSFIAFFGRRGRADPGFWYPYASLGA